MSTEANIAAVSSANDAASTPPLHVQGASASSAASESSVASKKKASPPTNALLSRSPAPASAKVSVFNEAQLVHVGQGKIDPIERAMQLRKSKKPRLDGPKLHINTSKLPITKHIIPKRAIASPLPAWFVGTKLMKEDPPYEGMHPQVARFLAHGAPTVDTPTSRPIKKSVRYFLAPDTVKAAHAFKKEFQRMHEKVRVFKGKMTFQGTRRFWMALLDFFGFVRPQPNLKDSRPKRVDRPQDASVSRQSVDIVSQLPEGDHCALEYAHKLPEGPLFFQFESDDGSLPCIAVTPPDSPSDAEGNLVPEQKAPERLVVPRKHNKAGKRLKKNSKKRSRRVPKKSVEVHHILKSYYEPVSIV